MKMSPKSCLLINFQDVTMMDAPSNLLASAQFDISENNINQSISYTLSSKKPIESHLHRIFTLHAVVNIGWCQKENSNEWIREGDFLSDERHRISLLTDKNSYDEDIKVICYCKFNIQLSFVFFGL